jgi:two-component system phosphate regulon sensor histidine kinase PhoR
VPRTSLKASLSALAALAPVVVLFALAWALAGAAWAFGVLAAVLALTLVQERAHFRAFAEWVRDPSRPVPAGSGDWEQAFEQLHRHMRATREDSAAQAALLVRFRNALLAMPDALMVLDAHERIEWCNPTAEACFGIDAAKDAGQPVVNLVRQPDFVAYLSRGVFDEPFTLRLARGGGLALSVRVVPYGRDQKLLLARDVTHAERTETMRRDFVANVSHEMKSPLTVLSGFVEMLADGKIKTDDRRGREVIGMMEEQATRMGRLIADLLLLSELESSPPAEDKAIEMKPLLLALRADAEALSAGRHSIVAEMDGPAQLLGSEPELRSAFSNLLGNAVRYTPERGEVRMKWTLRAGQPVFEVRDTGIGIDARHIPRLTERFYRVDSSRSRETGGTGLGLAIVKHVASRHQASLEIDSDPGRGSRFTLVFPVRRMAARALSAA